MSPTACPAVAARPTPALAPAGLDEATETLVRVRVRRLIRHYGFNASDREDLEQELRWHLVRCSQRFEPGRVAWSTYAGGTIDKRIKELVRARMARMRDYQRVQAGGLDVPAPGTASTANVHGVEDASVSCRERQRDLRLDLRGLLDGLSEDDRALCGLLASEKVASIARSLQIPRWRIYERIAALRQRFAAAGLGAYL